MLTESIVIVCMGVLLYAFVSSIAMEGRGGRNELQRMAQRLGLKADASGLHGAIEGVPLRCEPPTRHHGWRVKATLACRMPNGVHVTTLPGQGQPMPFYEDNVVFVEGPWSDLQRILQHPAVGQAMFATFSRGNTIEIDDVLRLGSPATAAQPIEELVLGAVMLAKALDLVWGERIGEVAETLGLPRTAYELDNEVDVELDGVVMRVSRLVPGTRGTWELRWRARFPKPLPRGTRMVAQEGTAGPDVLVNDAILDKALRISGEHIDRIRDRICHDDVRGLLLDVLCGHPGSSIEQTELDWRIGDGALDPEARLADVLKLVKALSG